MTTTCLISSFNYASYVVDAIDGALRQTVPFDQIVVVDDGSTDGSVELLSAKYGKHPRVEIVTKDNRGQLSCFNEGFARATGDTIFFLDADDVYEPNYVEQALNVYRRMPECDFVCCGRRMVGQQQGVLMDYEDDRDLGYSVIHAALRRAWIGGSTSCLSMRRKLLSQILPLPFVDDWRIRADDCLVFGASLAGGRKYFLAQPLVRYGVHGKNHYHRRQANDAATYRRRLAINRLFEYLERKYSYNVSRLAEFAHREFQTIERPDLALFITYARICMGSNQSPFRRLGSLLSLTRHYLRKPAVRTKAAESAPTLSQSQRKAA